MPETFHTSEDFLQTGSWILVGFYLQLILAFFSHGLEHGHAHVHMDRGSGSGLMLLLALMVHSLMEGAMLGHPHNEHGDHQVSGILMGIVLHKVPAAFALVAILAARMSHVWVLIYLFLFAIASPLGLALGQVLGGGLLASSQARIVLFAIVAGNFLHISTSIFFESNPTHQYGLRKLLLSLLGAALGFLTEWW
ncbi:MAG: ZIP family metal transporter [Cytophagales bacterium]|nr:ZIP family metal transporter [Cytophagales bacterium]